jgi:centractin
MQHDRDYGEVIANQPVVIDNGSGIIKAGFAGEESVKCCFSSFVGRPKHQKVMVGAKAEGEYFIGQKAEELRGILTLKYPLAHGVVQHWDDMELIWRHIYSEMKVNMEEHPVLLTEAPLNPRKNREKAAEIFFETFGCPALFVSAQAILSLYASGRTTGVVLDAGDGVTHAVPVYEGFALPHAVMRSDVAGRDVTEHLMLQLRRTGHVFHTSAEREVVRQIKEKECYVSLNPQKENLEHDKASAQHQFRLPDGNTIALGSERFRAPEILFQPSIVGLEYPGIHELLAFSINRADLDLRMALFSGIVLSGGSTMFDKFGERLLNEIRKLAPKDIKIRISAPPDRKLTTWLGGSILASLATFKKMWVSKEEFEEEGFPLLHKKAF